jgi:ribosome maturation factor RimP
MDLEGEIRKLAEGNLVDAGHFVVDVTLSKGKPRKLLITVDGDNGISIDDCAELSRRVSEALDNTNLIADAFVLEVSTPGLDQPLKSTRQYVKNIGRNVRVRTKDKTIEGKLNTVNDQQIELLQLSGTGKKKEEKSITITFQEIEKTIVLVSFK